MESSTTGKVVVAAKAVRQPNGSSTPREES